MHASVEGPDHLGEECLFARIGLGGDRIAFDGPADIVGQKVERAAGAAAPGLEAFGDNILVADFCRFEKASEGAAINVIAIATLIIAEILARLLNNELLEGGRHLRSMTTRASIIGLAVLGAGPAWAETPKIEVSLKPIERAGTIVEIQVAEKLIGYIADKDEILVTVPSRIAFTPGQIYEEGQIVAEDSLGTLPLRLVNVKAHPGQFLDVQEFRPTRKTQGDITLRYIADVTPSMAPRERGPSYDLRGMDGGFGGAFFSFLLLPNSATEAQFDLSWDFTDAPPTSKGVTTRGAGTLSFKSVPGALNNTFIMGREARQLRARK